MKSAVASSGIPEENEDTQEGKYLTFLLDQKVHGIEIRTVTEIVGFQPITPLPDVPPHVKGIINLRGKAIPVCDVRTRFRLAERAYDDRTCIIVVQHGDSTVGLIVDTVFEVVAIPASQIERPPRASRADNGGVVLGVGKVGNDVKILLDVGRLLDIGDGDRAADANRHEEGGG